MKDLSLTESIKDDKGKSILQHICQTLYEDDEDFINFKSEFKQVYQASETIDIQIQYGKFKLECKEALDHYKEIKEQDADLEQTKFGKIMKEFITDLETTTVEIEAKMKNM